MIRDEGVVAAYRGLTPTVMALLPSWAIYFPVYEHMKRRLAGALRVHLLCVATAHVPVHWVTLLHTTYLGPVAAVRFVAVGVSLGCAIHFLAL